MAPRTSRRASKKTRKTARKSTRKGTTPPQLKKWNALVAKVRAENPGLSFGLCLKKASKINRGL